MDFKIPKRFELLGHTIKVIKDDSIYTQDGNLGLADYKSNEIRIVNQNTIKCSDTFYYQIFLHELVHFILYYTRKNESLSYNEELVDSIADLLTQYIGSKRY